MKLKKSGILGVAALALAAIVLVIGLLADFAKDGDGAFADALVTARENQAAIDGNAKAVKNAASVEKKSATAKKAIANALTDAQTCDSDMTALTEGVSSGATGDADIDALRLALSGIESSSQAARGYAGEAGDLISALDGVDEGVSEGRLVLDGMILELYRAIVADAYDSVSSAETAIAGVREGALKVYSLIGTDIEIPEIALTEEPAPASAEDCETAMAALLARAEELQEYDALVGAWSEDAASAAAYANVTKLSVKDRLVIMISDNFIGLLFTAFLLAVIGLIALFLAAPFKKQWSKNPVFSVFIAMLVMLVAQTYALGFAQGSIGAWAQFWFDNTFNVLRANTSVGMIALGMTLVIIIGGIDLAVGSTLAGVGTVLMTMIDLGEHGVLVKLGITGVPAFLIGILVALAAGLAIGGVIGLLVTKGRIPAFIATLGIMNIVRSVSQYFTKSYTPTVPKEFEAIANTMVFGQRPMTIIYWLLLAVIFFLIMKHTAFGRYVYAVGSNERTTRLSGINVDKVKLKVYMLCGLVVAIASVSQLSRLGGMDVASAGNGYELDAIAAVVVGGTSMSGGRGSIVGTVIGVLIIGIMNNLLILLGVDSFLTDAFKGAIVVVAVLMQRKEKLA